MNVGQIKRFVNDGLVPVNRLIGSPSDTDSSNTIYGLQKKILTNIGDVKDGIAEVKEIVSAGNDGYYLPSDSETDKLFSGYGVNRQSLPATSNVVRAGGCWAFTPKYSGVLTFRIIRGEADKIVLLNTANLFSTTLTGFNVSTGIAVYEKSFNLYLDALKNTADVQISNTSNIYDQLTNAFPFAEELIQGKTTTKFWRSLQVEKGLPVMLVVQFTNNYSSSTRYMDFTKTGLEVFGKVKNFID